MVSSRDAWTLAHSASLFIVRICYDEVQVEVEVEVRVKLARVETRCIHGRTQRSVGAAISPRATVIISYKGSGRGSNNTEIESKRSRVLPEVAKTGI